MGTASENSPAAIVEILRQRAWREPERVAFIHLKSDDERESLTYGALHRRAAGIATWLGERGTAGERAILAYPCGFDFIAAFFGCLYAGVQPVPLPAYTRPRHLAKLAAVAANCRAHLALSDRATLQRLGDTRAAGLDWIASDEIAPADDFAGRGELPALAYLQYTSGSTAEPRGVCITHANLMAHLGVLTRAYSVDADDVLVSWLPHFHDMGLVGKPLFAVFAGAPCVLMSPLQFMQKPLRWLQAITEFRGSVSAAPNFAYELCLAKIAPPERRGLDLSSWRVALNGAEPVRPDTHRRFMAAFAASGLKPEALSPCYGLAEATLMVSSSPIVRPARIERFDGRELVSCGPPNDGVAVAIVDPETGADAPSGATGEIWVKGASIAAGYFASPAATAETFAAHRQNGEGPYLRTGDLGFFHEGELFIAGRLKDLIIVNGRNLHPQDVEQSAQQDCPAVVAGRGAAFAVDVAGQERLVLVQELHRHAMAGGASIDLAMLITEIRAAILNDHEVHAAAILLVGPGSVPVTSSGKLARHAARAALLGGRLTPVAAWYDPLWRQG